MIEFWIVVWYLAGVVGCFFGAVGDLQRGQDVSIGYVLGCSAASLFGVVILFMGLHHYLENKGFFSKVIFKGKLK